jgi:hypothetical protein
MRLTPLIAGTVVALLLGAAAVADEKKAQHAEFDALLKRYVDANGLVDYKKWKANDTAALDAYLKGLATIEESKLSQDERIAFWLNAHNAMTVRAVLEFHPISSVKDKVSHVPFGYNLWKEWKRTIAGSELCLDDLVNKKLRKLGEPRVHFAIAWAAKGSPILRSEAYEAASLDAQLEDQVQKFLADAKNFKLDRDDQEVCINEVFKWFGEDFGADEQKQLAWLAKKIKDDKTKEYCKNPKTSFEWIDFDWALNEKN